MLDYKPYKHLKSYQQTTIIYDFTVKFTEKYIKSYRTREQMDHAARSGKQNIAEGSELGKTSSKSELRLLGVARASLRELSEDYEDYLRQNSLNLWVQNSSHAMQVRQIVYHNPSYPSYSSYLNSAEEACNAMICLINQTTYLLDKQMAKLENDFIKKGGYSEHLYKKRIDYRSK